MKYVFVNMLQIPECSSKVGKLRQEVNYGVTMVIQDALWQYMKRWDGRYSSATLGEDENKNMKKQG